MNKVAALMAAWLVGGCLGGELDNSSAAPGENLAPRAALRAPVIAPLGEPVRLDARASEDPEGEPLLYIFEFNDGSEPVESSEPVVEHIFDSARPYTVRLRVLDLQDQEGLAIQDISVREEYPDEPDFCETWEDCVVGDECHQGVCYANGGSVD